MRTISSYEADLTAAVSKKHQVLAQEPNPYRNSTRLLERRMPATRQSSTAETDHPTKYRWPTFVKVSFSSLEKANPVLSIAVDAINLPPFVDPMHQISVRRDRTIAEVSVRKVRLEANILLLENPHRHSSSIAVSLVKDALVCGILAARASCGLRYECKAHC